MTEELPDLLSTSLEVARRGKVVQDATPGSEKRKMWTDHCRWTTDPGPWHVKPYLKKERPEKTKDHRFPQVYRFIMKLLDVFTTGFDGLSPLVHPDRGIIFERRQQQMPSSSP